MAFQHERIAHWDAVANRGRSRGGAATYYQRRLQTVYRFLVPPHCRVLEIGCAGGDLLASVAPRHGVGIDFSCAMVQEARTRHPHLQFSEGDAHTIGGLGETFDFVILSDLVNDLWDVQQALDEIKKLTHPGTRLILNVYSRLWEIPLRLAQRLGLAQPVLRQNWLTLGDLANLLRLAEFAPIRSWQEVLLPLPVPVLAGLCNRVLARIPPLNHLALTNFLVARPAPRPTTFAPHVSVVVPARNEAGNIAEIFERVPELGSGTELVFVEGHSQDDTYAAIERELERHPKRHAKLLRQDGEGKGDAVRSGFAAASGDLLMILDADMTVPPEDLHRFYDALCRGHGELVNGVRLVYPMEDQAMRFANLVGNKLFSLAFSSLLGQTIRDTLCGTKAMWRSDYERLAANRGYFGDFDPFGDFDLLFGASKLNLAIVEVPIRYRERTYGTTNIQRWRHGWLLLRMCMLAAVRLRLV